MPTSVFIQELEAEGIPGGYPTTPKSDRIGRDTTPILEYQPPLDLKNTNDVNSATENDTEFSSESSSESSNSIQQETNGSHVYAVNDGNLPEKSTSDNVENNGFRNKTEESGNGISSTPFLPKDSIPFDLNGDYNINPSPSSENDSINGRETQHHVFPIKPSENDSVSGRATQHYVSPITTSPENMTYNNDSIGISATQHHVPPIRTSPENLTSDDGYNSEDDSIGGRAMQHHVPPIRTSPKNLTSDDGNSRHNTENDSIGGRAMQNQVTPIKTSRENSTFNDESPHYNTPTDSTANGSSSIDRDKNITNVLYTSREVGPDGVSGEKHADTDKQSDQNDHSSHKATMKNKVNSKIGTLKRKIGKLINL